MEMVNVITESGIDFIADNVFHIEKSDLYRKIGEGIKSVEFVRVNGHELLFVEAKTTFANPNTPSAENLVKYQKEIDDICSKFVHSLNLFSSVKVGAAEDEFSNDLILPAKVSLAFILVVKQHELKWCRKIGAALLDALPTYLKTIWKPTVYVLNHETAIKYSLAYGFEE